jgi:hypothetical protein
MLLREDHANRAARVLLGTMELDHLWDERGPTERGEELIAEDGGPLPPAEATLLLATDVVCGCWFFQSRELTLRALLRDLEGEPLRLLFELVLVARRSPAAVEAWLDGEELRLRARRQGAEDRAAGGGT